MGKFIRNGSDYMCLTEVQLHNYKEQHYYQHSSVRESEQIVLLWDTTY